VDTRAGLSVGVARPGIELKFLGSPACSVVTIMTELTGGCFTYHLPQHGVCARGSVNRSHIELVVDVIGFLCVSLGSSTVQLHDSLCSRRVCACSGFSGRNGNRA
jgi:hypothetical protein